MKHLSILLCSTLTALLLAACGGNDDDTSRYPSSETQITSAHLEMPAPKGGKSIVIPHTAVLNDKSGATGTNYTIEWDTEIRAQRWCCYKMYNTVTAKNTSRYSASNDGSLSSTCQYPNDTDLPVQYRFTLDPYRFSGYDHGHICPSADRLCSKDANYQTFFITNMQPQDNDFNAGIWSDMETQVRIWAANFDTLYVCKGGTIDKPSHIYEYICQNSHQKTRVNANHIPVPRYFFTAVLGRTGNTFKATAFWIDQTNYSSSSVRSYVKTVGELQELTGIDFFHSLPDNIENEVENVGHPQMQREWDWYK
jgi:endonuclease G